MTPRNRLPEPQSIPANVPAPALTELLTGRKGWKHTPDGHWTHKPTGITVTPTNGGHSAYKVNHPAGGDVFFSSRIALDMHLTAAHA